MTSARLRRLLATPVWVLYSLWAMLFYQLVFTAWTLQYSFFGVLGVLAASLLFLFSYGKRDRKTMVRFTLFSLAISLGIPSFASEPLVWVVVDYIVFVLFALILGVWLVRMPVVRLVLVIAVITLAELWVPLSDMSVLSHFGVEYTGHLGSQDSQIPSIPVAAAPDPARPGLDEVVTLQAHRPVKGEAQELVNLLGQPGAPAGLQDAIVQLQHSYDVVGVTPGRFGFRVASPAMSVLRGLPYHAIGLVDFPFTTSHFLDVFGKTRMYLSLSANPGELLQMALSPGHLADGIAGLSLQTAADEKANWDQLTGRGQTTVDGLTLSRGYLSGTYAGVPVRVKTSGVALFGVYRMLSSAQFSSPQAVLEGNNLIQVIALPPARPRVLATLKGSFSSPLTTDVVFADVAGTGVDDLLVNTVPAQILRLTPDLSWRTLWVSGRRSFRFETVFPQKGGDLLIANSPGFDSDAPTRYLGGYLFEGGQLVPQFRVYHNDLVSLHTVHVTSATTPELLTSVYAHQEIMLLKPSEVPWLAIVEGGYVLVILIGWIRRFRRGVTP